MPQIIVEADGQSVNLLEAGHRIADAAVRFSALEEEARAAIKAMQDKGDALALAKLAPTSLVFGFWDSRDTGYKSGRLLSSTIRASNVAVVSRSGQYVPSYDTKELGLTAESFKSGNPDDEQQDDLSDTVWAKLGLVSVPVPATKSTAVVRMGNKVVGMHGGVRVLGEIVRRTQLNLVGLRSLVALADDGQVDADKTMKLRRYILGLALIAGRCQTDYKLREGCNLVNSPDKPPQAEIVYADGRRPPFDWNIAQAFAFARKAAQDFGVQPQPPRNVPFNIEKVRAAVKKEEGKKPKKTVGSKK